MSVKCTAAGQRRTVDETAWISEWAYCPDCGARARVWVRATDLFPHAKMRAHDAPEGVTPGPYEAHPKGAVGIPD